MFGKQRLVVAGVTAILMFGLGACGGGRHDAPGHGGGTGHGGGYAHQEAQPHTDRVVGLRDTVRHVPRRTVKDTRPHMVKKCTPATKRVKHTKRTGSGAHKKTRTWYTTERYRDCTKVQEGTETYRRVVQRERWCVKLDDVNGDTARDDVWYRVTRTTYNKALGMEEHTRINFVPVGIGC
ncbi:hypothetical protein [Streptomyces colonosanans]|uniref:Lipoprotein n=1 Tax=Streptomyces colonosanans TaxID=1428652 RepID=A0A1S2NT85_9ACTN|nr:hypothetical protein [Streptomyces colonosanans]OIJ84749.1 hypothetical protein BIV24_30250 [Streptomyces colonosanans]